MAMRNELGRNRATRPVAEDLEGRQMLSGTVSGIDIDGDRWTIRLIGPGALRVTNQNDSTGSPAPLTTPALIRSIEVAGTNPLQTKIIATVKKASTGDGKVFFGNLTELANRTAATANSTTGNLNTTELINNNKPLTGSGLLSIDMPNFWLGDTAPATPSTAGTPKASISIPDGVNSFRFGGADTTAFFGTTNSQRLNQNGVNDSFAIRLGLPAFGSTRVIIDQSITSGQAAASTIASPTQDSVIFTVNGRLDLFQANAILGNSSFPSAQFAGGTIVESVPDTSGITGAIGNVRVGGNATNFSVVTNDRLANFFIGGETNNIFLLTPIGSRNISFGRGMDNVIINTASIELLSANRGAINANVTSSGKIGRVLIGGDVVDSEILSGYVQGLSNAFSTQTAVTTNPTAQTSGSMQVRVAGSVKNSVFAASVQPDINLTYGTPNDLVLEHGSITAKVEGSIDNSALTPDTPTKAFFAKNVSFSSGPVIPPNNPEAPYTRRPLIVPGIAIPDAGGLYQTPRTTKHKNTRPFDNSVIPNTSTSANPVVNTSIPKVMKKK